MAIRRFEIHMHIEIDEELADAYGTPPTQEEWNANIQEANDKPGVTIESRFLEVHRFGDWPPGT